MANGVLTPLQMIAGAGLLQNQGITINPNLLSAINTYNNQAFIQPLFQTIIQGTGSLQPSTIQALLTIGSNTVPALSDSVPTGYSLTATNNPIGLTGIISTTASIEIGGGDVSKFIQALNISQSYIQFTDQFITSAINSQTYLGGTFTNMNNMITGDITQISTDTKAFGFDLLNLGSLINLETLNDLGSPAALLYQITRVIGVTPPIQIALDTEGLSRSVVITLNDPKASFTDNAQKLMYLAMTKITGTDLKNILSAMKIKTAGIETMADLLNPVKLFPTSFQTLTVVTVQGQKPIYATGNGDVNSTLLDLLPPYIMKSTV
jgi:hypothetical protein